MSSRRRQTVDERFNNTVDAIRYYVGQRLGGPGFDWACDCEDTYQVSDGVLDAARRVLDGNEAAVVALIYGADLNQREAADCLGVSPSRVSQLHAAAIRRLAANREIRQLAA